MTIRIFLGAPNPKVGVLTYFLAENCMKMKEFDVLHSDPPNVTNKRGASVALCEQCCHHMLELQLS